MAFSQKSMMRGAFWTIGAYGTSVALRFGSNVVLSRLVAPEVFGVMLIVNTLRNGIELISDVGVGQNVVQNPNGEARAFRDTAWTIQVIRGVLLFAIIFIAAIPLGQIYQLPSSAIQLSAVVLIILAAGSLSVHLLSRHLQFIKSNLFELGLDLVGAVLVISLAFYSPTIWSLIAASIIAAVVRTAATYFLPEARNWFGWNAAYARQILSFGKWIYLSSLLTFLCASFDKLYLGQSIPFALLGIYGLARNVADLPTILFARLGYSVVFPVISSQQSGSRTDLRSRLSPLRLKLLLACAVCIAFGIAFGDFAIRIVYDSRYHAASWMLPIMLVGGWAAILCSMNEYALMGVGKPLYGAAGNLTKLASLVIGFPLALQAFGLPGVIVLAALSELLRYLPIAFGQRREQLSFFLQDIALTAFMFSLLGLITLIRWNLGLGIAFDGFLS